MGGSSKQVSGYKYFANFLLFIGNPIERLIAINFDKRGWEHGKRVPYGSNGEQITIDAPNMYGENEGGVSGLVYLKTGTDTQTPVEFYQDYLGSVSLPPLAYPFQSYLAFKDFYLGNSGYMKEMLLWPQRIHVKNDGSPQWYDSKSEILENGVFKSGTNETIIKLVGNRDVPAGVPINISTTVIGGEYGVFDNIRETVFTENGSGLIIPQSELDRFSVDNVFSEGDLTYVYFDDNFEKVTANLDHADHLDPNWDVHAVTPIPSVVTIESVGFDSIYFIDIRSRIELMDFSVKFSSSYSYIFTSQNVQYSGSVGLGFTEGVLLSIVLAKGDTAIISYKTKNKFYPDYINGVIRSQATVYATNMELSASTRADAYAYGPDINPIHKIREILTDDTAMNKPEFDVNDVNFMKAADRIWDEGLGISWSITEKSCIDAINELCSHIEAGIRVNRQTGLYEMVLFRDDWFEESEIHSLAENKIKSMQIDPINVEDVKNYLNVSHYDRENIKDASFSIAENASIKNAGGFANAEAADFPYFMNQRNAAIVAQWKLKQFTTPCWKGTFTTGLYEARKWNRYDIVKLNWSRKGIANLPVRIMSINLGDGVDNTVSIEFVEVVPFSDELTSTVVIDDKIDTVPLPPQPAVFKAFELSYFEAVQSQGQRTVDDELALNSDMGYVAAVAQRPQNNSLNAQLHTDAGAGYENSAVIHYCETALIDQDIDRLATSFILKSVGDMDSVRVGSQIFINDEIMVYQAYDDLTKVLTVKRGALDTMPLNHVANSILYFADDFVSADPTEYMNGEIVDVKAVTTTPSGVLNLDDVDAQSVEIQSRAIRPYPPANVQINGEYFPAEIETDLVLTWVDRNRQQQTGGSILGWYESGVTLEADVTYQLILIERDQDLIELRTQNLSLGTLNTYTFATSAMDANTRTIEIILKSLRNGYECIQPFSHTVELSEFFSAPYNLSVVYQND